MNILKKLALTSALALILSGNVWAATVTFGDHAVIESGVDFQLEDDFVWDCQLSLANPTCTFGTKLDQGERLLYDVTAPVEFDFYAILSTGPDFGGYAIQNPPWSTIPAGTTFTFIVDGNVRVGQTQWLTVSVDGIQAATDYFLANGGTYPLADTPAVPVPAAFWLFGSGLLGLIGVARRKSSTTSQ